MAIVSTFMGNTKLIVTTGGRITRRTGRVVAILAYLVVTPKTDLSRQTLVIAIATSHLAEISKECKELNILADILTALLRWPTLSIPPTRQLSFFPGLLAWVFRFQTHFILPDLSQDNLRGNTIKKRFRFDIPAKDALASRQATLKFGALFWVDTHHIWQGLK